MNRLLSRLERLDGQGHIYILHFIDETPRRALARQLHKSPKEAYDGERASRGWRAVAWWRVTATNTMEAIGQACERAHRDADVAQDWERGSAAHGLGTTQVPRESR